MRLLNIDKVRYRSRIKQVMMVVFVVLMMGSLAIAQALIAVFPAAQGTHFHWNLTGVAVTAFVVFMLLKKYKTHAYMVEVAYVWNLKQALNQVVRKLTKLHVAAQEGQILAFQALHFFYEGSRQLANLDDNTIVLEELEVKHAQLRANAERLAVVLDVEVYDESYVRAI